MKPGNDNCHAYVKIIQLVSNEKYVILVVGVEKIGREFPDIII